jgi:hypothetical protein
MFQGFALGIKGLLCRWRNRNVSNFGENQAKSLQDIPSAQPASAGVSIAHQALESRTKITG